MAVIDMVDTNIETACRLPTILHDSSEFPSGHEYDKSSINLQ